MKKEQDNQIKQKLDKPHGFFCHVSAWVIFLGLGLLLNCTTTVEVERPKIDCKEYYDKGVNDALQTIMLHDLELTLQNKKMTWGERANVVRQRLKVAQPDSGKSGKI